MFFILENDWNLNSSLLVKWNTQAVGLVGLYIKITVQDWSVRAVEAHIVE